MSVLLSCVLSDHIAAIGTVAGAYSFPWNECPSSRPVPTIVFHGTADPIVPYLGGESHDPTFPLPAIPAWVETLVQRNGCNPMPDDIPPTGAVSGLHYSNCTNNADVIFYTIAGSGHSWPGGVTFFSIPRWAYKPGYRRNTRNVELFPTASTAGRIVLGSNRVNDSKSSLLCIAAVDSRLEQNQVYGIFESGHKSLLITMHLGSHPFEWNETRSFLPCI